MAQSTFRRPQVEVGMYQLKECMEALDRGLSLTRFTRKRPPLRKFYRVRLDTRQLVLIKSERSERPVLDLHEVKEIRRGQNSKDFEKWPKEARDHKMDLSFILYYGSEFRLNCFSVVATDAREFKIWTQALDYMVSDARNAPYPELLQRWLRQEFYKLENKSHMVPLREFKPWLIRIGYKAGPKSNDLDQVAEVLAPGAKELNFEQFLQIYKMIVHQVEIFDEFRGTIRNQVITLANFQDFLGIEQKDRQFENRDFAQQLLNSYLETNVQEPTLNYLQFMDFLYSKHNLLAPQEKTASHDMSRPLSHYWINSSHNTYLTGDQFTSESSCEAYVRVLRQGCKCIELDCWDGDNKEPIIYHGRTLTSRIPFKDVVHVIKEHAWDVSDYPLILSIENHCSLDQQKKMARYFTSILGDNLLVDPIKRLGQAVLPSPKELHRKILLKHRKLPQGEQENEFVNVSGEIASDDLSQSEMTGLGFLQDPVFDTWNPHFFVLSATKLMFSMETEEQKDDSVDDIGDDPNSCRWFHHNISREETIRIFQMLGPRLGDGAFLVRPSQASGYSLSFWRNGRLNHCRIGYSDGKFSLVPTNEFDNIQELVEYYQTHALHGHDFHQVLTKPIPKSKWTLDEYYKDDQSRESANDYLMQIPYDGAFLIRKRSKESNSYAISFRAEGKIRHCRFSMVDGVFVIGSEQFGSLEDLVDYYRLRPLYRTMKLRYPTNRDLVATVGQRTNDQIYVGEYYAPPNEYTSDLVVTALYPYEARSDKELGFTKGDIIINVNKALTAWWRGDFNNKRQGWFPSNYVEDMELPPEASLGALENASIPLKSCSVVYIYDTRRPKPHGFRVTTQDNRSLDVGVESEEEARKWESTIRELVNRQALANVSMIQMQQLSRKKRLALELSDLVIYCRTVDFEPTKAGPVEEMSSLVENKAEKWSTTKQNRKIISAYNTRQLSRVYPKGLRIDSSNYDPIPMWIAGCHLVALNFQTSDEPMQLNHGKFMENGGCGYLLKPDFMLRDGYDPHAADSIHTISPLSISLTILGARNLPKRGRNTPSPQVLVEIAGCTYDTKHNRATTNAKSASAVNPVWKESWVFDVTNPDLALIRMVVQDVDVFGDPHFLGHATYPVKSLRQGYRSVPLCTGYGEEIHLSALLVYVELGNPEEDYEDVYRSIKEINEDQEKLQRTIEEKKLQGDVSDALSLERQLERVQRDLEVKKGERRQRIQQKKGGH